MNENSLKICDHHVLGQYLMEKKCVGEINYASLSTIDLSIASTVNDKREIEIDYIQSSIPHHLETGHKALKKGGCGTY